MKLPCLGAFTVTARCILLSSPLIYANIVYPAEFEVTMLKSERVSTHVKDVLAILTDCVMYSLLIGKARALTSVHRAPLLSLLMLSHSFLYAVDFTMYSFVGSPISAGFLQAFLSTSKVDSSQEQWDFLRNWVFIAACDAHAIFILDLFMQRSFYSEVCHKRQSKISNALSPTIRPILSCSRNPFALLSRPKSICHFAICILVLIQLGTGFHTYTPTTNVLQTLWRVSRYNSVKYNRHANFQILGERQVERRHNNHSEQQQQQQQQQQQEENSEDPNVFLIINESLGNLYMQTEDGLRNSPFFVDNVLGDRFQSQRSFFYFERAHAVSGITDTAMPGVVMGSALAADRSSPLTQGYFVRWSIMGALKAHNYTTVLYCSYNTFYYGRWDHLTEMFSLFDHVYSRQTLHEKAVNLDAMDDRKLTALIVKHLSKAKGGEKTFAVVLWNNLHYPFLANDNFHVDLSVSKVKQDQLRYLNSLKMTDDMTRKVFAGLNASGRLDNTIVVFAADHGETPGQVYTRAWRPVFQILRVPLWFYVPPRISKMRNFDVGVLDFNRDKMVSNLDVIPTLVHMLDLSKTYTSEQSGNDYCGSLINGSSLLLPVQEERHVAGYQGQPFVSECEGSHAFVAYRHNLTIFRAKLSDVEVEIVDPVDQSTVSSIHWNSLDHFEQRRLRSMMLKSYPSVVHQLHKCGFSVF